MSTTKIHYRDRWVTLVAVGLYGIVAYRAATRRNEIGIRISLGSTRALIAGLVLRDNLWLSGAGLAIGLPLALAATRSADALLFIRQAIRCSLRPRSTST